MQKVRQEELSCQGQDVLLMRLREEQQAEEVRMAVEDPPRRQDEVKPAYFAVCLGSEEYTGYKY